MKKNGSATGLKNEMYAEIVNFLLTGAVLLKRTQVMFLQLNPAMMKMWMQEHRFVRLQEHQLKHQNLTWRIIPNLLPRSLQTECGLDNQIIHKFLSKSLQ